jgi:hypothetical protein
MGASISLPGELRPLRIRNLESLVPDIDTAPTLAIFALIFLTLIITAVRLYQARSKGVCLKGGEKRVVTSETEKYRDGGSWNTIQHIV